MIANISKDDLVKDLKISDEEITEVYSSIPNVSESNLNSEQYYLKNISDIISDIRLLLNLKDWQIGVKMSFNKPVVCVFLPYTENNIDVISRLIEHIDFHVVSNNTVFWKEHKWKEYIVTPVFECIVTDVFRKEGRIAYAYPEYTKVVKKHCGITEYYTDVPVRSMKDSAFEYENMISYPTNIQVMSLSNLDVNVKIVYDFENRVCVARFPIGNGFIHDILK